MEHHHARVMRCCCSKNLQLLAGRGAAGRLGGGDATAQEGGLLQCRLQSRSLLLCSAITAIGFGLSVRFFHMSDAKTQQRSSFLQCRLKSRRIGLRRRPQINFQICSVLEILQSQCSGACGCALSAAAFTCGDNCIFWSTKTHLSILSSESRSPSAAGEQGQNAKAQSMVSR